ncbi:protein O-mannosyltransferase 1 [Chironomus tepperi]|uniref:protein O-mannosyltransferase 1 n=1 Tax=Chironomus tepperi TaxID=113505 RepID=UPI00391F9840
MGTEMKAPENCENIVRNRKQKSAQVEHSEKTAKVQTNGTEQIENKEDIKKSKELKKTSENPKSNERLIQQESEVTTNDKSNSNFVIKIEFDPMSIALFTLAIVTRFFRLSEPRNIVFDELHYGKYVSLYMKNVFFFEKHPPLGKQLIAGVAHFAGYDGNYTFNKIGSEYTENVPIFWLRLVPALCGSLLVPVIYNLLLQLKINKWVASMGGLLIVLDNALLTQSRFILMEPMLLIFSTSALLFLLRFLDSQYFSIKWWLNGILAASFYSFSMSIKYVGFYSYVLGMILIARHIWSEMRNQNLSDIKLFFKTFIKGLILIGLPIVIYLSIFYIHLYTLYRAGPHDSVMTSAFQASLEGGLASITHGQPLKVVHGSQITLRHTNGRPCWLHSHADVYPVKYEDKRGSSHQQQVTCYSFKDVNNWWIVKRPSKADFSIGDELDDIKHGDEIQLVHGLTSRALNSHDVAAPMSPQSQEVSCYIDYNISMPGQLLWRVEILNKEEEGDVWHAIKSHVRLVHVTSNTALRFTGRQLPQWGYNQHEVAADKNLNHPDSVFNVEEHRYTKSSDQKERERQLLKSEMIPMERTQLSFWQKFRELQIKMFWQSETVQNHMYSSEPLEWPLMSKGIAYWYQKDTNAQIHLLGNIALWYSCTISLFVYAALMVFYLLRRRRQINDLNEQEWIKFESIGCILFVGYVINFAPYFFVERTLFLHNYLPALIYKICLLCALVEHVYDILRKMNQNFMIFVYKIAVLVWLAYVFHVFQTFLAISYGRTKLTSETILQLRWKDTWDFIFS